MFTTIITIIFILTMIIGLYLFFFFDVIFKDYGLKHTLLFNKIARTVAIVSFTVFNFLFSFSKPEYVFQQFFQFIGNSIALEYFFFDFFYLSERKRAYILWMQKIVFKKEKTSEIFETIEASGTEYKKEKKSQNQLFSLVNDENNCKCIFLSSSKGGLLLRPKIKLSNETLMLYAQKIEIDIDQNKGLLFCNKNLIHEAIQEYDYGNESKIYKFIRDKLLSKKGINIMKALLLMALIFFVGFIILGKEYFDFDFFALKI